MANEELNETDMRQLKFDLDTVMTQFNEKVLGAKWELLTPLSVDLFK